MVISKSGQMSGMSACTEDKPSLIDNDISKSIKDMDSSKSSDISTHTSDISWSSNSERSIIYDMEEILEDGDLSCMHEINEWIVVAHWKGELSEEIKYAIENCWYRSDGALVHALANLSNFHMLARSIINDCHLSNVNVLM